MLVRHTTVTRIIVYQLLFFFDKLSEVLNCLRYISQKKLDLMIKVLTRARITGEAKGVAGCYGGGEGVSQP
jgi:hypothetical protein